MSIHKDVLDDSVVSDLEETTIIYAGFWIRVGAALIDAVILSPLYFLSYYNTVSIKSFAFVFILLILSNLYKPLLEFYNQATYGKQFLGLKVVNENFGRITLKQSFLRFSPWLVIALLAAVTNFYIFQHPDFDSVEGMLEVGQLGLDSPTQLMSQVFNFVFFISLIKVAFSKTKRGLHDDIAKTYCIET